MSAAPAIAAPRERPILFSGPMVLALLEGRKTQTRRIISERDRVGYPHGEIATATLDGFTTTGGLEFDWPRRYEIGDRLWVKETFRLRLDQDAKPPSDDWWKSGAWYDADDPRPMPTGCGGGPGKLRPSIFMPRWASRITLEVTGVRVERLKEISPDDVRAEGVETCKLVPAMINGEPGEVMIFEPRKAFAVLWDQINGETAPFASNPWVRVIQFRRVTP